MNALLNESTLLSFHQLSAMLAARRRLIAFVLIGVMLITGAITTLLPRQWTASSDVYVDYRENDPIGGRNFSAMLDDSYMQTQIDMIKSQVVAERVARRLKLDQQADYQEAVQRSGESRARDALINGIIRSIVVANKRGSRVLEVAYIAKSPEEARERAHAVVESFIELSQQIASKAARSRSEQYNAQLEQLRAEADAIQEKLSNYQRETGLLEKVDSDDLETRRLNQMMTELAQYQIKRQEAQARNTMNAEMMKRGAQATELPEIGQLPGINDLKTKLSDVDRRLSDVQGVLGSNHPTVLGLLAERRELQNRLARESRVALDSQRNEANRLELQESALQRDIAAQRAKVMDLIQHRDRVTAYQRQLDSVQQVYSSALQKYDGLLMVSNITLPSLTVLREAELPSAPTSPSLKRNLIASLPVGLMLGLLLALLLELRHRVVRCEEDLARGLPIPVIGRIGARVTGGTA